MGSKQIILWQILMTDDMVNHLHHLALMPTFREVEYACLNTKNMMSFLCGIDARHGLW